jgi:hypothetical protein
MKLMKRWFLAKGRKKASTKTTCYQTRETLVKMPKGNVGYARLEIVYNAFPIQKVVGHDKEVPKSAQEVSETQSRRIIRYIPVQGLVPPLPSRKTSLALGIGLSVYSIRHEARVRICTQVAESRLTVRQLEKSCDFFVDERLT